MKACKSEDKWWVGRYSALVQPVNKAAVNPPAELYGRVNGAIWKVILAPVRGGLKSLLWEQIIRRGESSSDVG